MNDGTAIIVYTLFFLMVTGSTFSWGTIIKFLAQVSFGAVGMGIAFGPVSYLWLGFIFNDIVIEITLTLAVSYLAYFTVRLHLLRYRQALGVPGVKPRFYNQEI